MSYLKHKDGSIEQAIKEMSKHLNDSAYQDMFKKELEKAGKGIGAMSDQEKKDFFNKIDKMYKAKSEELGKEDEKVVKKVTDMLKGASAKHAAQAKMLDKAMKEDTIVEKIEGLEKKAEKSGMPYSILKQVYDRGMAAYKTGHRPGTTAQQWAFARVNSFITKSSGTWGKADKDLADKVRGSKKEEVKKEQKDRDIPAKQKYSKLGGFYYWDRPVKYNSIKKFYYHPKGAKPFPPGRYTRPSDPYEEKEIKEGRFEVTADVRFKNQRRDIIQDVVVVVNAKNKEDAEDKAIDFINNERMRGRWPKPYTGGNFSIDEFDPTDVTPTTRKLGVVSMGEEKDNAYAIGMAAAKKKYNDEPPLEKKTIKKGHEIAKSIEKDMKEDKAADMERARNMRDKIADLQAKSNKLDKSTPEGQQKDRMVRADMTSQKLKLQDLMKKISTEKPKEQKEQKEGKKKYHEIKKDSKTTMTDKPMNPVDTEPKLDPFK